MTDVGSIDMITGAAVKVSPLLACPLVVTTTSPVVAPTGTMTVMLVALQLVIDAAVPLNVTVLNPCVAPKFVPVIVTACPTAPDAGFTDAMFGGGMTANVNPLLR